MTRWGARIRRKSGVASTLDIARVGSGVAMRRGRHRPALADPGCRGGRGGGSCSRCPCEVGVRLCRVGLLRVWVSLEDVLVVFGGPRTGKTQ